MEIIKGTTEDIDELEKLYDSLNDYLANGTNYPGWRKRLYPTRETAEAGINKGSLFVLKADDRIAGSIILNHEPENGYDLVKWGVDADYKQIIVIHTMCVHPDYMNQGIGRGLLDFAKQYSISNHYKAIRLDVSVHNTPAISLYEKCGYRYIGTVDLGLGIPDLVWFRLYETAL